MPAPAFGQKTSDYPYGYGLCQCGCNHVSQMERTSSHSEWVWKSYLDGHEPKTAGDAQGAAQQTTPTETKRHRPSPASKPSPSPQPAPNAYDASARGLGLLQLPSFTGDTCLTLTMALADSFEEELVPLVRRIDPEYSSDDRILSWLCSRLRLDIHKYYRGNGPCLCELLTPDALEVLDKSLCLELSRRLEKAYPGVLDLLVRRADR